MVLPCPIDAAVAARIALALKSTILQEADRGRIAGNAGCLKAMQPQRTEGERDQDTHRRGHVALACEWRADPLADGACLCDAAANVGKRKPTDHRIVIAADDQESIGEIVAHVFSVAFEPPAEGTAREIVGGPGWLPGNEEGTTCFAQGRPFRVVAALGQGGGAP